MIRLAARVFSLAAAVAMTSGATAALTSYGMWKPPYVGCGLGPPLTLSTFAESGRPPPPPLPRFIHPRATRLKAPEIVCEVPDDQMPVRECGVTTKFE